MAKKKRTQQFPTSLYVVIDSDGDGNVYFLAERKPEDAYCGVDEGKDPLTVVRYVRAESYAVSRPFQIEGC